MRIALMVIRLIYMVPTYIFGSWYMGKHCSKEKTFAFIKRSVRTMNKKGRVKVESYGVENLPKEDGFVIFPNHQGMFDIMAFLDSCPRPFSFVFKKEVKDIILLKQIINALNSIAIDRSDLRQSMRVIQEMTRRVSEGENFIIFAEGTRSKKGNETLPMKGGSFKSAVKAQAPIVPCALIDSFKPFDQKNCKKVTVKVIYLKPLYYEDYKDMTTIQIAELVREKIDKAILENT